MTKQVPTITLIQSKKGKIFGGYASTSWIFDQKYYEYIIPDSFLLTLENIYDIQPTKFPKKIITKKNNFDDSISFSSLYGLRIGFDPKEEVINGVHAISVGPYEDILGKGSSIFTGEPNSRAGEIEIKEIKVFKLLKNH